MNITTTDMLHYFDYSGTDSFKKAICAFLTRYFHPAEPLDPGNVYVTTGGGAALDTLAMLLSDPGDCFLTLAPQYNGLISDFGARAQAELIPVQVDSEVFCDGMTSTEIESIITKLEASLKDAIKQGSTVKGIVIVNPGNPIGEVIPREFVKAVLQFSYKYDIHTIMDEIFANTILDDDVKFSSVLSIPDIPDKEKTHFVWGFSKDFGLAGLRCGVLYSWNQGLKLTVSQFLYFGAVSLIIQHKLQTLISDFEWLDRYFTEYRQKARQSRDYCMKQLTRMNIPFVKPRAAYFIWADLSKYLSEPSSSAEMTLFKDMIDARIYFFPGQLKRAPIPGWFRITFTHDLPWLKQGLTNLEQFLTTRKQL